MSDSINHTTQQQRQRQQRQILTMMGIAQWVQPSSPTLKMADIDLATEASIPLNTSAASVSQSLTAQQPTGSVDSTDVLNTDVLDVDNFSTDYLNDSSLSDSSLDSSDLYNSDSNSTSPAQQQPIGLSSTTAHHKDISQSIAPLIKKATESVAKAMNTSRLDVSADNDERDKVVPFDLQGARYNNWVLMVDIQALDNNSQKLWQNIIHALSLDCETASFPICAGMDTAELANASLAGYIFKIGRSEEIQVAALTELPVGLTHPNLVSVTTLEAMLADSALKRQLWQQISQ